MRVLYPQMASWLLTLPLAFAFWWLFRRAKGEFRRKASIGPRLASLSQLTSWKRDAATLISVTVALGSLVLAMMRPQIFIERRTPELERQDLILLLDRSASMRAKDIKPSRFAHAVQEIKTFLAHKPEGLDRIALVGFAGTSLVLSHFTTDVNSLLFYLDWIQEDPEPHFGTDMGVALMSAKEIGQKDSHETKKILLIISDGEDQGSALGDALTSFQDQGWRVYCIGIGSDDAVPIPTAGGEDKTTVLRDERGGVLTTRFNETTLRHIALVTGGQYFRSVQGHELTSAMHDVLRAERRVLGWKQVGEYRDLYHLALLVAVGAVIVLLVLL